MRFHVGFSFRWKHIKKYLKYIIFVILAYFCLNGFIPNAYAESFSLPITGGGGGLTYVGGEKGGQNAWCTQTINNTEYVYRCGGLYSDTFSAGFNTYGDGTNNLLSYSTSWFANTNQMCSTTQTSIEFYVYAYPFETDVNGRTYDFWDYYNITGIAFPNNAASTCSYSRISKNTLKVNCVYNTGSSVQFNMYGSLNDKEPPYMNSFKLLIRRNINYFCTATTGDLNNSINDGFNNLNNAITNGFDKLNQDLKESLETTNDLITDETLPNVENAFNGIEISSNTAVSDLILMPINYLQKMLSVVDNQCKPYKVNFNLFNSDYDLNFPCLNLEEKFGSDLWNVIDLFICFYLIYNISMLMITSFEDITTLRDTYGGLYQPRHHKDSRVSRGEEGGLY